MQRFRQWYDKLFLQEYSHLPPDHAYWAKKVTEVNLRETKTRTGFRGPWQGQSISELGYLHIDDGIQDYNKHFSRLDPSLDFLQRFSARLQHTGEMNLLDVGCGANTAVRDAVQHFGANTVHGVGLSLGDPRTRKEKKLDTQNNIQFFSADLNIWQPPHDQKFDVIWSKEAIIHMLDVLGNMTRMFECLNVGGEMWVSLGKRHIAERFFDSTWMNTLEEGQFDVVGAQYKSLADGIAHALEQVFFQVPYGSKKSEQLGYTSVMYKDVVHIVRLSSDAKLIFPGVEFNPDYGRSMKLTVERQDPHSGNVEEQAIADSFYGVYVLNKQKLSQFMQTLR